MSRRRFIAGLGVVAGGGMAGLFACCGDSGTGDSGPITLDGNFNWTSDRIGTFQYRCGYHGAQMIATLQITA